MTSTEEAKYMQTIMTFQNGFIISKVMITACELGIFDLLRESEECLTSETISERLGTSHMGMKLLLEACAGLKLLKVDRRDNKALYGNTEISNLFLARTSPKSQYPYTTFLSELFSSMQYLPDAVREGKKQVEKIFGDSDVYEAIYRSEEKLKNFTSAMNCMWLVDGRNVMAAFDLSGFPHICDIGGGGGALAKECVSLYPNSTVTIFDLPKVVETAKKHFVSSEERRITFHEGNFLSDPVPEADLYILARILHNRGDVECMKVLSKLYKACKPGGGVAVVELVLDEDRSGPLETVLYSLLMLTLFGGREQTFSEHSGFLHAAGFKDLQLKKIRNWGVILGRK